MKFKTIRYCLISKNVSTYINLENVVTNDFGSTKNEASNRTIIVDQSTLTRLQELGIYQEKNNIEYKNLAFTYNGKNPPTNNAVNKSLKRALKRAGVTTMISHHGLRHSHVSQLLHQGINIKYISRRVGHSDVSTTLNKYSHIIDEMEQLESQKVNELLTDLF